MFLLLSVCFFLDSVGKINKMLHELTNKITQKDSGLTQPE